MNCANCNRSNRESSRFCIHCGASLSTAGPAEGTGVRAEEPAADFRRELSLPELQAEVERLSTALNEMRSMLASDGLAGQARRGRRTVYDPHPSPAEQMQEGPAPVSPSREPVPQLAGGPSAQTSSSQSIPRDGIDRFNVDWELILGGNWLARVGILAVIIGVAFFLKLAFDNQWIGEAGRVVLGIAGGLALLGLAEYLRTRYMVYAQTLAGGGIAVLYLSIFAAFSLYGFLNVYMATGILFGISATAATLALRYNAVALAVIGIVGAFTAPFVLGAFGDKPEPLELGGLDGVETMVYVVIVDLAVLALSTVRNWRWFTLLALLGSLASFGLWYEDSGGDLSLLVAHGSLTAIFLIFVGATTLFHVIWKRVPEAFDQTLMIVNALAYFGISYGLLWDELRSWMGTFSLLMALFYVGVGVLAFRRSRENVYLSLTALGIAIVFFTVAIPVQLGGPWISVAWAVEGSVLFWLSFRLRRPQLRVAGLIVLALSAVWLLAIDTPEALQADLVPFYNPYLTSYVLVIAGFLVAAHRVRRHRQQLTEYESELFPALLAAATLFVTVAVPVQVDGPWIAFSWAVEALALVWMSVRFGIGELRIAGAAVFAAAAVRLLGSDTQVDLTDFRAILNLRMMAFASVVAALYLAVVLVTFDRRDHTTLPAQYFVPALAIGANFLTLWVLSAEWIAMVDSGIVDVTGDAAFYTKSLGLSLIWAVYASVGLAAGIVGRWRFVRLGSLGLLAVPILKLFLFDSLALEQGFRVAAFLSVGLMLLILGFLYQRYSDAVRGFLFEEQEGAAQK